MGKKTVGMVQTETELAEKRQQLDWFNEAIKHLDAFSPATKNGTDAKTQGMEELTSKANTLKSDICKLESQLEVLTVEMIIGKDTEFAEPTPSDALRNAS